MSILLGTLESQGTCLVEELYDSSELGSSVITAVISATNVLVQARVLLSKSVLVALPQVVEGLPSFCHPYLSRMVSACLAAWDSNAEARGESIGRNLIRKCGFKALLRRGSQSSSVGLGANVGMWSAFEADQDQCLSAILGNLPKRLSIPALLQCTPEILAKGSEVAGRFACVLEGCWDGLNRAEVTLHMREICAIVALTLDYRRTYGVYATLCADADKEENDFADINDVQKMATEAESRIVDAVVTFCLKLTESEMRALLARLSEWKNAFSSSTSRTTSSSSSSSSSGSKLGKGTLAVRGDEADEATLNPRATSFYQLLGGLGGRLKVGLHFLSPLK